jgi:hypothetical protein
MYTGSWDIRTDTHASRVVKIDVEARTKTTTKSANSPSKKRGKNMLKS